MASDSVDLLDFRVTCAWCGKHIKGDRKAATVSHSICDLCDAEYRKAYGLPPRKPCSTLAEEGRRSPALAGTRSLAGQRGATEGRDALLGESATDRRRESGAEAGMVKKLPAHLSVVGSPAPSPARGSASAARASGLLGCGAPLVDLGGVA